MSAELTESEICLSCMECCRYLYTPMPWVNPEDLAVQKEFYKARGAVKVVMLNGRFWAVWPWKCPHLTKIGCDIYEHRPIVCREYDGRSDPLMQEKCKLPKREIIQLPMKGVRV